MNSIGMFYDHFPMKDNKQTHHKVNSKINDSSIFEKKLAKLTNQSPSEKVLNESLISLIEQNLTEEQTTNEFDFIVQLLEDIVSLESNDLLDEQKSSKSIKDFYNIQQINNDLNHLITKTNSDEQSIVINGLSDSSKLTGIETNPVNKEQIKSKIFQILAKLESILSDPFTSQKEVANKLIKPSKHVLDFINKYNREGQSQNLLNINEDSREQRLWHMLDSSSKTPQINMSDRLTDQNILKWLKNALNSQLRSDMTVRSQRMEIPSFPVSKIEQYMIHLDQTRGVQPVEKQLFDQFKNVIQNSRFLSLKNDFNQLSIQLSPDKLGEMTVRMTEINGEMSVKIIVSSQSTRHMLESNIHQLKNMFAPHQVVIEELDVETHSEEAELEDHDQPKDKQEESDSHQSNKEKKEESKDTFERQFKKILMNEKV